MTSAILFPISMVAINLEGFSVSQVSTLAKSPSCFFSISICILFAETKAISIPEKNAEKSNEMIIMSTEVSKTTVDYPFFSVQIAYDTVS